MVRKDLNSNKTNKLIKIIEKLMADGTNKLIGGGFNGAAAMSSRNVGAAAVLKRKTHTVIIITAPCIP